MPFRPSNAAPPLPLIYVATPERIHFESPCRTRSMTIVANGSAMRPLFQVSCSRRESATHGTCHSDTLTDLELWSLFWAPEGEHAVPRTEVCFHPMQRAVPYTLAIPAGVHDAVAAMLKPPTR